MEIDWNAVGAVGELLGAIAVVASLVYVGSQIRFSARAQQAALRQQYADSLVEWNRFMMERPEINRMMLKTAQGLESLGEEELELFMLNVSSALTTFSAFYRHYQEGMIDEESWQEVKGMIRFYCGSKGVRQAFDWYKDRLAESFRRFVADIIAEYEVGE